MTVPPTVSDSLGAATMVPISPGSLLTPKMTNLTIADAGIQPASPVYVSTRPVELVSAIASGCNLQILYRYTRSVHLYSTSMVTVELTLVNCGQDDLVEVKVGSKVMIPRSAINACLLMPWINAYDIRARIYLLVSRCTTSRPSHRYPPVEPGW